MSALKPDAVDTHDLGTTGLPWKNLHVDALAVGARSTGANVPTLTEVTIGSNAKLSAGTSVDVEIFGDLTVHGASTTITSANLAVEDKDIQVNKGGSTAGSAGSGLEVLGDEVDGVQQVVGYLRVSDASNANLEFKAPGNAGVLTLDIDASKTLTIAGALNVSGDSAINQDLTTTADAVFNKVTANGGLVADNLTLDGTSLALSAGNFTLDVEGDISLDANGGDITLSDNETSKLSFDMAGTASAVVIANGTDGDDLIFKVDAGATEVMRLDDSAGSLLMADTKKIEFGSANAFIHHDNTDLVITDDADINLVAGVDILLDAASLVRVDGNLVPNSANGGALGTNALEWSDLFLADGGVISLGTANGAEVTLSHVAAEVNRGVLLNSTHKLMLGSVGSFVQETAAGKILMSGSAEALDAVKLASSSAAGGITLDAGTAGLKVDSEGQLLLQGAADSEVDVVDANLTLKTTNSGGLALTSAGTITATGTSIDVDVSGEIRLDGGSLNVGKDDGGALPVAISATTFDASGSGAMTLSSTSMELTPSSTFALDAGGVITIDGSSLSVGSDNDTGAITLKSTSADATIQTSTSGKIALNSAGLVDIDSATGITLDSTAGDIELDAAAGSVRIEGAEAEEDAIHLHASNAAGGIQIDAGTSGVDLGTTGLVSLESSLNAAKAVELVASAGGIDILASGAAAGEDIDIVATGSSVNVSSSEDAADAIVLSASAGGIDISAVGEAGQDIDITNSGGSVNISASESAADAIVLSASHANGGIDLSVGGSVVVSVDADSVDIAQDVNITGTTPTLKIGDGGEEDTAIIFDGSAVDFHIGLDDDAPDKLSIGLGSTVGTTPNMTLNSADRDVTFAGDIEVQGGKVTLSNGAIIDSETNGTLLLTEDLVKTSADLEVTGNLTVNGTTTTVDTDNLQVKDKNILINDGGANAASTRGAGLSIEHAGSGNAAVEGYIRVGASDETVFELRAPGNDFDLTLDIDASKTLTVAGDLNVSGDSAINQDLRTDAAVIFSSVTADGGVTVDDLTLDGTSLALSDGNFALDSAGNIELNADGGTLTFADGAANLLSIANSSTDVIIKPLTSNKDIIFHDTAEVASEIARIDSSAGSLLMASGKKIQLGAAEEAIYGDGTDIHFEVGAGGDVNIPADIGLTFGHATDQKIEGNGTNLTLSSGADIDLTASADINIPSAVGLKFGTDAQGIEADGNLDLTITAGRDLILTPTADVVVSGTAKLEFNAAGSGEHITGDGTDLTVASGGNIVLDATSAVLPGADSADDLGADDTAWANIYVDDIVLKKAGDAANGNGKLILDADKDTSIRASEDDVISFQVSAADRLHLKAASLQPHSSTTLDLGTAAKSFSDLYLADAQFISFQDHNNAQNVTLTHVRDKGLALKNLLTTNASGAVLTLQTGDTDIAADDVLGSLEFQAPDEGSGTDAIKVAAAISAVSEGNFSDTSNATKLSFKTAADDTADEKMSLSSAGVLTLASAGLVIPNNATIGSASDTDAIAINASGDIALSSATASSSPTTGALKVAGGLGVAGELNVAGATELDGTLKVVLQDLIIANAAGTVERFKVTGGSGNTEIAGTLEVDGNCTLGNANSDLHTVNGGLTITGVSTTSNVTSTANNNNAHSMDGSEYVLLVITDNKTVTLPNIGAGEAATGQRFIIKRTADHSDGVTVARAGTDLIDGGTSVTLGAPSNGVKSFIEVISDGTNYHIITSGGTVTVS